MFPRTLKTFAVIVAVGLILFSLRQRRLIEELRMDLMRQEAEAREWTQGVSNEVNRAGQSAADAERLRASETELARLRNEATALRSRIKEMETAQRSIHSKNTPAVEKRESNEAATDTLELVDSVETYNSTVNASIAAGETLVIGGWRIPGDKHVMVLADARPEPNGESVLLNFKFVEIPDANLASMGLEALGSDAKQTSAHAILSQTQSATLLEKFKTVPGVDVLSGPRVMTGWGTAAEVNVSKRVRTANGEAREVGPLVSVLPQRAGDGVSLNVSATYRLALPTEH